MLDGRVKTCTPCTAACWPVATSPSTWRAERAWHQSTIDMLVVNLKILFGQATARPDCTFEDAIENIDIGGPAMPRAPPPELVVTSPW